MKNLISAFILSLVAFVPIAAQTRLTNLPTLYITTDDGIDPWSKTTYQSGRIIVKSSDPTEEVDMVTEIRGRGNSTWSASKKPYRIKLDKKHNLLNNKAKAKSWVLLANDFDKALIRNAVAFKISELLGFEFSPSSRFVDLVLNGTYRGNYQLTDQMQVHKNRVPVEEIETAGVTALPDITGGYLIEVDGFAGSPDWWYRTNKGMPITIHSPDADVINVTQYNYIKDFTQKFETALFASNFSDPENGFRKYVDEKSLVDWYIGCELTGNPDSFWSTYMYKYRNVDKFYFGPLWDFDIAFNNDSRLGDATYKLMRDHAHDPKTWIKQLWKDPWFKRAVNDRWTELVNGGILNKLLTYIDETKTLISASQVLNENKWHKAGNYQEQINTLKSYLQSRINFLTESFGKDLPPLPSQPFVPEDFYYMLMNVATNNVIEVADASPDADVPVWMMNAKEDGYESQRWVFVPIDKSATYGSEGYYQIINENSGMAIAGNGKNKGLTQVKPSLKDYSQMWQVRPVLTGDIYGVVNFKTGLAMTNKGGNPAAETPAIEYDTHLESNENEQWYLKKMETITELPGYPAITEPSGISGLSGENSIRVYPNPVSDRLFIRTDAVTQHLTVKIYSIDGRCVYQSDFYQEDTIEIPVSDFLAQAGVYVLNVNGVVKKLVIR
ncbi:CotH kinase family protein [Viscerimonas tarda]